MKLLTERGERKWFLVKEWKTEAGLLARIQKCVWNDEIKSRAPDIEDFCTGYVQKRTEDTKKYYESDTDVHGGVTFESDLEEAGGIWVGFDMAHFGDENIKNQEEYAQKECEKLAKQMI